MLGGANAQTVHFTNVCFVYVKRSFLEGHVNLADHADLKLFGHFAWMSWWQGSQTCGPAAPAVRCAAQLTRRAAVQIPGEATRTQARISRHGQTMNFSPPSASVAGTRN